jgi:general secretion pathway protein A
LRYHVASLEPGEVGEYIEHRLRVAGGDGRIQWAPEALTFIYSYSRGIPRLINVLCDKALLAGYIAETFVIDATNIRRAIEDTECRLPARATEPTTEVLAG